MEQVSAAKCLRTLFPATWLVKLQGMAGGSQTPLTAKDVMQRLGYRKPDAVYALIRDRRLTAYARCSKRGGKPRWVIFEADLAAYLESIRSAATVIAPPDVRQDRLTVPKCYIDRAR